ncbi:MAG TPA: hypothetical protein VHM70_13095 [Polyangiaceae bacterium]|nr:hypothetical protein [Polyangiaceae bacterium]
MKSYRIKSLCEQLLGLSAMSCCALGVIGCGARATDEPIETRASSKANSPSDEEHDAAAPPRTTSKPSMSHDAAGEGAAGSDGQDDAMNTVNPKPAQAVPGVIARPPTTELPSTNPPLPTMAPAPMPVDNVNPGPTPGPSPSMAPTQTMTSPGVVPPEPTECKNTSPESSMGASFVFPGALGLLETTLDSSDQCQIHTTACLEVDLTGSVHFFGQAAAAQVDYTCWGALFTVNLADKETSGEVLHALDAQSQGITSLRLDFSGVEGGPAVRVSALQAGLPGDAAFVFGGGTRDIVKDGVQVLDLNDFRLPSWSAVAYPEIDDLTLDASKLLALTVQVVTEEAESRPFDFSVASVEWLDSSGEPVSVLPASQMGEVEAGPAMTLPSPELPESGSGGSAAGL